MWELGLAPSYYLGNRVWTTSLRKHLAKKMDLDLVHYRTCPNKDHDYYRALVKFWDWYDGRSVSREWFDNQTMVLKVAPLEQCSK